MRRREALRRTFTPAGTLRSFAVALIVGTALNAINQGAELWSGRPLILWKLALTYAVPFLVASYGAYAAFRGEE